jgi:hypothetical protein
MNFDAIVAIDTIVAFVILLVALLTSSPAMWCLEHLWNFSVLKRIHLSNIVIKMTLNHSVAAVTLDTIVPFDTGVAFDISLVALLTSSTVMWRKEHLWNFTVLQRLHVSDFV